MDIFENQLVIYTDGSSLGNPGAGGYGAVLVYKKLDEVIELGGMKERTTNNEMELTAAISALSYSRSNTAPATIVTDSQYVINGITKWVKGWKQHGWTTQSNKPVAHQQLWKQLDELVLEREQVQRVSWLHVPGHQGVPGNERADTIAQMFAGGKDPGLYRGKLAQYPHAVTTIDAAVMAGDVPSNNKARTGKAYSYLSLVDGVLERHDTWTETKARVDGKKALYRKALSKDHEEEILRDWGVER